MNFEEFVMTFFLVGALSTFFCIIVVSKYDSMDIFYHNRPETNYGIFYKASKNVLIAIFMFLLIIGAGTLGGCIGVFIVEFENLYEAQFVLAFNQVNMLGLAISLVGAIGSVIALTIVGINMFYFLVSKKTLDISKQYQLRGWYIALRVTLVVIFCMFIALVYEWGKSDEFRNRDR